MVPHRAKAKSGAAKQEMYMKCPEAGNESNRTLILTHPLSILQINDTTIHAILTLKHTSFPSPFSPSLHTDLPSIM